MMLKTCQNFFKKLFDRGENANRYSIWNKIKCREFLLQIMRRSSSIFKENHAFIEEEDIRSDKIVFVEEELDGIDIDSTGNLVDLPRLQMLTLW